jgi:glycosyltransferase involved in cell wall biosynthesis
MNYYFNNSKLKKHTLSILIPTFNREKSLLINLKKLASYFHELNLVDDIEIVISDNSSSDNTFFMTREFLISEQINFRLFSQVTNIGLEKNALFCLSNATSEYVMFLGDDDYITLEYLNKVYNYVTYDKSITCILMNSFQIDNNFNSFSPSDRSIMS